MLIEPSPGTSRGYSPGPGTVFLLMSGGVDSSVAALLLRRAEFDVVGVTMDIPGPKGRGEDVRAAAETAREMGIPHYAAAAGEDFRRLVMQPFVSSYLDGLTPNPCSDCNARLKFGLLWDSLDEVFGPIRIATGHYARIVREGSHFFLARGRDAKKDQSYFLSGLARERLSKALMPLGDLTKDEVRSLAREAGLPVAERQESMEICFTGEGNYRRLLDGLSTSPGLVVDESGAVLGTHDGVFGFTVGQRRGLGIASRDGLYVLRIDARGNRVVVGPRERVCRRRVRAQGTNLLYPGPPSTGYTMFGKTRSRSDPAPCDLVMLNGEWMEVLFHEPQFAPAPGQRLVLYDDAGRVVAGGEIEYCEEVG
ncbi:MAG: tRNA 2-thiouridine(34) synthase MnmA [Synergistaceae bacterium]|nr:tRNA 2-thiouridine(34) synthase MnmA [Synergistota bacterium]NLM71184.1 tRNA 2-thiouridine(34) synthase MnmA [Synergistaceae bacterium]